MRLIYLAPIYTLYFALAAPVLISQGALLRRDIGDDDTTYNDIPEFADIPSEPIADIHSEPIADIPSEPIASVPTDSIADIPPDLIANPIPDIPPSLTADMRFSIDFKWLYSKCSSTNPSDSNWGGGGASKYYVKCERHYKNPRICQKSGHGLCEIAHIDCSMTLQPMEQCEWCNAMKTTCLLGPSCVVAATAGLVDGCTGQVENGRPVGT